MKNKVIWLSLDEIGDFIFLSILPTMMKIFFFHSQYDGSVIAVERELCSHF